jgi:hypothetical protein
LKNFEILPSKMGLNFGGIEGNVEGNGGRDDEEREASRQRILALRIREADAIRRQVNFDYFCFENFLTILFFFQKLILERLDERAREVKRREEEKSKSQ